MDFSTATLTVHEVTIRALARLIGLYVSMFPACPLGRAHYRSLEKDKIAALKRSHGNFDAFTQLSSESIQDIKWWIHHLPSTSAPIHRSIPSDILFCDSSGYAWGAVLTHSSGNITTQGFFSAEEKQHIIAVKELFAIYYGFKSFLHMFTGSHVLIRTDNTVALSYVQKMGGINSSIMDIYAKKLWSLAADNNIWISASFIAGRDNTDADFASRKLKPSLEWSIPASLFSKIVSILGPVSGDFFASRLNHKTPRYFSMLPDPFASQIDAFSVSWSQETPFLFPPFNLIFRCLEKIQLDSVHQALIIFPMWTTQHWMSRLLHMLISPIFLLPHHTLFLPWPTTIMQHPMEPRLQLGAALLSADQTRIQSYLRTFSTSLITVSELKRPKNTLLKSTSGKGLCFQGIKIPIYHL